MSDGINDAMRGSVDTGAGSNSDCVNHPTYYGGANDPYEAIKIIEYWKLGFCLGNVIKYILRAPLKENYLNDLKKAAWYLNREIENAEKAVQK